MGGLKGRKEAGAGEGAKGEEEPRLESRYREEGGRNRRKRSEKAEDLKSLTS